MPDHYDVLELRQYTLHPGARDTLISLFDREFVESQEEHGARIVGQFRELDDPDRFVWLRAFPDMDTRAQALAAFYGGPVWRANREAANATMIDSTNVLLLRPSAPGSGFSEPLSPRPGSAGAAPARSLIVATVFAFEHAVDGALRAEFARSVRPALAAAGTAPIAVFETEPAENTYPALPVRTGEHVLVCFSTFANLAAHREYATRLARSPAWTAFATRLAAAPSTLRLEPTSRSALR